MTCPTTPTRKGRPSIRERAAERICPNCGKPSGEARANKVPPRYCSPACKREMGNRNLRDGAALVSFVKAWRIDRGQGEIAQAAFRRICEIADMLNNEDRDHKDAAGNPAPRPRADYHAAVLLRDQRHTVCDLRYGTRKRAQMARQAEAAATAD